MKPQWRNIARGFLALLLSLPGFAAAPVAAEPPAAEPPATGPSAPAPHLAYAFSARIELAPPVEIGTTAEGRRRFIAMTGGTISGPRLHGVVLPGGGDWQTIHPGGLTDIEARYFLKADDGTIIAITNPGVRTASPEVIDQLARGEPVAPDRYYFRTTPRFDVADGPWGWLRRQVFVGRGIRRPDHVDMDFYTVE